MAGGTFESQNKVRPGVYIRFKTASAQGITLGERGTVAICEPLSWGPVAQVITIEAGDDVTGITGYDMTDSHNRFLQEIFRGSNRTNPANKVLLYRPAASSSAAAAATIENLTCTAKYAGARGNDIVVIVTENVDTEDFTVSTVVDGVIVDTQSGSTVADLTENAWVSFSGTGDLTASTGTALTGGADGTVNAAAYSTFLTNIEPYKFDVLCYDGSDSSVLSAFEGFIKRIANENGQYAQLVCVDSGSPDSRFIINVENGIILSNGDTLTPQQTCWWVSGVAAGAAYNQSLTFAKHPGAFGVSPVLTNSEIIDAINAGKIVFSADDGDVKIETDINSLVTYTSEIGKVYRKNRVVRLCNSIANDIYKEFSNNFIGIVNNNELGRSRFKSAVVGYLIDIQANEGIQNFSADDVEVLQGTDVDAVVINISIQPVDAAEKIYMTVEVA